MPKSPFSGDIALEWERLVTPPDESLPLAQKRERWRLMYERSFVDGNWQVSPDDAGLVVQLGTTYAFQTGDYQEALDLCLRYLAHPSLNDNHHIDRLNAHWRYGCAWILLGKLDEGTAWLLEPLQSKVDARYHALIMRSESAWLLEPLGLTNPADPRISNLYNKVLNSLHQCAPIADEARIAETYGDLAAVLQKSCRQRPSGAHE